MQTPAAEAVARFAVAYPRSCGARPRGGGGAGAQVGPEPGPRTRVGGRRRGRNPPERRGVHQQLAELAFARDSPGETKPFVSRPGSGEMPPSLAPDGLADAWSDARLPWPVCPAGSPPDHHRPLSLAAAPPLAQASRLVTVSLSIDTPRTYTPHPPLSPLPLVLTAWYRRHRNGPPRD